MKELMDVVKDGEYYNFYGVHDNCFKLGSVVFDAIEDPDDGYRSYLQSIPITDPKDLIFSTLPIVDVRVEMDLNFEEDGFFKLVDVNNHTWLTIGTDHTDEYYPWFVFDYTPNTDHNTFATPKDNLDPKDLNPELFV